MMMRARAAAVAIVLAAVPIANAEVRMDEDAGVWRDNLTDLTGLVQNKQGVLSPPSGYTVDPSIQRWSQPFSTTGLYDSFSAGGKYRNPPIQIDNLGSDSEALTLRNWMYEPGVELAVGSKCWTRNNWECDGDMHYFPDGWYGPTIIKVPYEESTSPYAGGWDVGMGSDPDMFVSGKNPPQIPNHMSAISCLPARPCGTSYITPSIGLFDDTTPLISGPREKALVAGDGYGVTFLASAFLERVDCHKTHKLPYLLFTACDSRDNVPLLTATFYESDFINPAGPVEFAQMTPFSFVIDALPAKPGAEWDFRAYSRMKYTNPFDYEHTHCTILGPVWVIANKGTYQSPVLDTMSDATKWVSISWRMDQTTDARYSDSSLSPIKKGSPLTPINIKYHIGNNPASLPAVNSVAAGGENAAGVIGMNTVNLSTAGISDAAGNPVTGRYFSYDATLYSRHAAAEFDSDLAPYPEHIYFGAYRPVLRELYVNYQVTVARAMSGPISPRCCIRRWRSVNYVVELPSPGAKVEIGVVAPDGSLLMSNVAPGTDLSAISPFDYPTIALCATLFSDPGDITKRPVLKAWEVRWESAGSVIHMYDVGGAGTFKGNGIRPAMGEEFKMQVCVRQTGRVNLEVHDASGQLVRKLLDEESPPGLRIITWNGRNERGEIVATGVYFVSARVPGGRQVRRLAVIR